MSTMEDRASGPSAEGMCRLIVEASPTAIAVCDEHGVIVFVNDAASALFGYERKELVGRSLELLLPERARSAHVAHRAAFLADPSVRPMGLDLPLAGRRKDGSEFPIEIDLAPVGWPGERLVAAFGRDTTRQRLLESERSSALEAEAASAKRLAAIVESIVEAIFARTPDGIVTSWNAAAEELFGYSAQEMIGHSVTVLLPAGHEEELEEVNERLRRGERLDFESVRVRKGGELIEVASTVSPIRDASGEIVGVSTLTRDISRRKEAERTARQLALLVETSADAIIGRTLEGAVTSWNAAAERMYGYTAQEMIGRSVMVLVPPERRHELEEIEERLRRGEHIEPFETVRMRKDGSDLHVSVSLAVGQGRVGPAHRRLGDRPRHRRA